MNENWQPHDSVRLEIDGLDMTLIPRSFSVQERERLLQWFGIVVSARGNGLFYVEFRNHLRAAGVGDVVLTVNAHGLRPSWHVGQRVRANPRFVHPTMLQRLRNLGISAADIPPRGSADVQGWVAEDLGRSRYVVELFIPWFGTNALFGFNIRASDINPVWNIGDRVHIISYVTEASMQNVIFHRPNVDLGVLRFSPGQITGSIDNIYNRYNISFPYPGEEFPIILQMQSHSLRSAGPN